MTPLQAAAEYAAFVWYSETRAPGPTTRVEARKFCRENWQTFLPVADEGWGRLLLQLARRSPQQRRKTRRPRTASANVFANSRLPRMVLNGSTEGPAPRIRGALP